LHLDFDPQNKTGTLDFAADIVNLDAQPKSCALRLSILDGDRLIHRTTLEGNIAADGSVRRAAKLIVPDVEPWSAEMPRRYDLDIELRATDGAVVTYRRRIGFRRVEVRGRQLLVNGAPIRLLGINRHDARLRTGRSMRYDDLRHDVLALR